MPLGLLGGSWTRGMREGRRWSGGVLVLLVLGSCLAGVLGHVQLAFPSPTLKLGEWMVRGDGSVKWRGPEGEGGRGS